MGALNIYIDESSQSGHRFVALGGIWIERAHVASVEQKLLVLRGRHGLSGELKWTKLSPSRRPAYEAFVDAFFSLHEHFLDSKKSHLLQVNDIILGAMAYLRNDRHLGPSASAAKTAVARNIMARAGLTRLSRNTPIGATFSVWNFRLAPKKAPRDPRP